MAARDAAKLNSAAHSSLNERLEKVDSECKTRFNGFDVSLMDKQNQIGGLSRNLEDSRAENLKLSTDFDRLKRV